MPLRYRPRMGLALLQIVRRWYALAAFWGYIAAFAVAFTMVIVFFPPGALAILFVSLLTLPVVVGVSLGLSRWERAWSLKWLRLDRCPHCRGETVIHEWHRDALAPPLDPDAHFLNEDLPPRYECGRCGALFAASGEAVDVPLAAA